MAFSVFSLALIMSALVCAAPKGAGSGYVNPNTFDSDGMLSIVANPGQAPGTPMELWMGVGNENAGMLVGYVTFYYVGMQGYVQIDLTDFDGEPGPDMFPFVATKIHIHFAPSVNDIPHTSKGNPIPGLFEYNIPVTDPYQTVYDIPVEFDAVGAIQRAIWYYVDNNQSASGIGSWNQYRVNAILCEVNANGEGFISACEDKVVFIVVPTGTPGSFNYQLVIGQPVIGTIAVECTSAGGTAWGDGKYGANFPDARQWGTYFYVDLN